MPNSIQTTNDSDLYTFCGQGSLTFVNSVKALFFLLSVKVPMSWHYFLCLCVNEEKFGID